MDRIAQLAGRAFTFSGRARRQEFGGWWLAFLFTIIIAGNVIEAAGAGPMISMVGTLLMLSAIVAALAATVRRLHDCSMSGWWLVLAIVLFPSFPPGLLLLGGFRGTPGPNGFGPDPREPAAAGVASAGVTGQRGR